jgi:hypothetical protein
MNIDRDESCNTPRFEVIGQCEGCGKTLFDNDDCSYTLDDIYLCKKCSQGIEQYAEPYKAEDGIPTVAKMNGEIKTCNNCLHHGGKKGRRCYDCTHEGDDLPKWERLSYDACLQMTGGEATTKTKEVDSTLNTQGAGLRDGLTAPNILGRALEVMG